MLNNLWLLAPPEISHKLAPYALKILSMFEREQDYIWNEISFKHLKFKNPLGISGGLDKNAKNMKEWVKFGAGFLEIGTVTLLKQRQNPGKVLIRHKKNLWNHLGFPNDGACKIVKRLEHKPNVPLFVNIGKGRDTSNETAAEEYALLAKKFLNFADGFVINVSSPNTKNLRKLLSPTNLNLILTKVNKVIERASPKPILLVKLSPDLNDQQLYGILDTTEPNVDGWVLTNTMLSKASPFPTGYGGVSGGSLKPYSIDILKKTCTHIKSNKLIISSGGVMSPEDVFQRIELGANLVQVYSGIVFYGPQFFKNTRSSI